MKIYLQAAVDGTSDELKIYDKFDNLKEFIDVTDLTDVTDSVTNATASVKSHSRLPYMRAKTTITVAAHARQYMVDTGRRKGAALPGKNFTIQAELSGSGSELRSFTYVGRMMDLHALIKAEAKVDLVLYGSTGARYSDIPAASE